MAAEAERRQIPDTPLRRRLGAVAAGLRCTPASAAAAAASPESPWAPAGLHSVLQPTQMLTEAQRQSYWEHGYLVLPPGLVPAELLERLQLETRRQVELSCEQAHRERFVYEEMHTDRSPRLVRLLAPEQLDTYWEFTNGIAAELAMDLLGPDVKFHHSKLNYKWNSGEPSSVSWHQDFQFWPHSNCAPLTIGVYLADANEDSGPMTVVPLSAHNMLHTHEDDDGNWLAILPDTALTDVPIASATVPMTGAAGTIIVHNSRCVHGSPPNTSSATRPLLLQTFTPASCEVIRTGSNPKILESSKGDTLIRGNPSASAGQFSMEES